ncbi:MAG: sugar phosphate isomerase/epimerase [Opitutaceae bacterium]|nr:sugar phosphate isomerase/epimerase [Opitutaceae bacterium]
MKISTVMDRRKFLRMSGSLAAGATLLKSVPASAAPVSLATPAAEKLGWQLSVQLFTYRRYPLFEAIDKVAALGIRHIEPRSTLRFDPKRPDLKINEDLPAGVRRELRTMLKDRGMFLSSFFADISMDPDQPRRVFEFCKEMGTETLVSEPPIETFDLLEKLCGEYQINLAIHNHQQGKSKYWKPDEVLAVCRNRSKRIGGCCDMGQWVRSGLDPVACLRQLEGRVLSFHLKDVAEKGNLTSRNVVLGEGQADGAKVLAELKRQRYRGLTTIDYEYDSPALQDDVGRYVTFVEARARELRG